MDGCIFMKRSSISEIFCRIIHYSGLKIQLNLTESCVVDLLSVNKRLTD